MPWVDQKEAMHRLHMDPSKKPVQKKKRIFAPERQKIIEEEIIKVLEADFIFEIDYLEWMTNVVLVQK